MQLSRRQKIIRAVQLLPFYMVGAVILSMPWIQSNLRKATIYKSMNSVTASAETTRQETTTSGKPVHLLLPSVAIDLDVASGYRKSNSEEWVVSSDKAHFANITSPINNKSGNTVIYGHDIQAVFKPTSGLKIGDELIIYTDNNLWFKYRYTGETNVAPTDTSVLTKQSAKPTVTLITCSGLFYQTRKLMTFTFETYGEKK